MFCKKIVCEFTEKVRDIYVRHTCITGLMDQISDRNSQPIHISFSIPCSSIRKFTNILREYLRASHASTDLSALCQLSLTTGV